MFQQVGLATVDGIRVVREGIFFDLTGQPLGESLVARLLTDCGDDYGRFVPFDVGDTVLYAVPMGDPGDGVWVLGRFFEEAEKVPQDIVDGKTDEWWVAKPGRKLTFQTAGGDAVLSMAAKDGTKGVLRLGSKTAAESYVLGDTRKTSETPMLNAMVTAFTNIATAFTAAGAPFAAQAASMTAAATAITTFLNDYSNTLSDRIKGEK